MAPRAKKAAAVVAERKRAEKQQPRAKCSKPGRKTPLWCQYWESNDPGTAYECSSKLVGRVTTKPVQLGKGVSARMMVVACATPLPPNAGQRLRGTNTLKEGAFVLEVPGKAMRIYRTHTQTRELTRPARGKIITPSPEQRVAGYGKEQYERVRNGVQRPYAPGLPYPARIGSSPCLPTNPLWDQINEMVRVFIVEFGRVYGRVPSEEEIVYNLQGNSLFQLAQQIELDCYKAWAALDERRLPKWNDSPQRAQGQRRAAFYQQSSQQFDEFGRNDAEYEDTLAASTRRAKRRARSGR